MDIAFDKVEPTGVWSEVRLGQHDNPLFDLEQIEDGQMLTRLGHHAFVGCDDEQSSVNSPDARKHVLDEIPMAGHVDDSDLFSARQGQPAKAEVNGHLPLALLLEPVGMCSREGSDEC